MTGTFAKCNCSCCTRYRKFKDILAKLPDDLKIELTALFEDMDRELEDVSAELGVLNAKILKVWPAEYGYYYTVDGNLYKIESTLVERNINDKIQ